MAPHGNKAKVNPTDKKKFRRPNQKGNLANLNKVVLADEVLLSITGLSSGTRPIYVKAVWKYIKDNNLQKLSDGRIIIPDQKLAMLVGKKGKPMNGFTLAKFIENHIQKT